MKDSEILLQAIGEIPDLVETAKKYKEINEENIRVLTEAVMRHPPAIVPSTELTKICNYVARTPCLLPDTDDLVKAIAGKIETAIIPLVRKEMRRAFGITEYTVKHEHAHTTLKDLKGVADKKTKKLVKGLIVTNLILLMFCGLGFTYMYVNGFIFGK